MVAQRILFHIIGGVIGALAGYLAFRLLPGTPGRGMHTATVVGGIVLGLALGRALCRARLLGAR